jgi:hypothetical protein
MTSNLKSDKNILCGQSCGAIFPDHWGVSGLSIRCVAQPLRVEYNLCEIFSGSISPVQHLEGDREGLLLQQTFRAKIPVN